MTLILDTVALPTHPAGVWLEVDRAFPQKPKGMWWKTYERLFRECAARDLNCVARAHGAARETTALLTDKAFSGKVRNRRWERIWKKVRSPPEGVFDRLVQHQMAVLAVSRKQPSLAVARN
jgi:hypothetical protein